MKAVIALVVFELALSGCTGEKPGDPCDKFFQNTCKAPMSCVDTGDNKVCASSCDSSWDTNPPHNICKDPAFEPVEVQYSKGTTNLGSAGCHCLPRQGGAPSAKPSASAAPSASAPPVASSAPTPTASDPAPSAAPPAKTKPKPKPKK